MADSGNSSGSARVARVAARIREDVMRMLLRGEIRDPEARGVTVSRVEVSADLGVATVRVRLDDLEVDEARKKRALTALGRASGYVRRELASSLGIRRVPEVRFAWDSGADHQLRVEELLAEIAAERKSEEP